MTWCGPPPRVNVVPGDGSQQSKVEAAISTLEKAVEGDTAFLWTGGKEANVIADLLLYAVGEDSEQEVTWVTVDTGNHYDAMYGFREQYTALTGDKRGATVGPPLGVDAQTERYDELLESVIENPADPRGYHGEYTVPECAQCGAVMDRDDSTFTCPECGDSHTVPEQFRATLSESDWGVPESCGALKTVPMRRLVAGESGVAPDDGFDTLITGRRGDDPLVPSESGFDKVVERRQPAPHTRINPLAGWSEANVYAYIKQESLALPDLYTEQGYRHTDSQCCTDDSQASEYGEGGRDPQKEGAREQLEDMGYV